VERRLIECVRNHYDDLRRVANDIEELGFSQASANLRERLPRTARIRSGEIGEILATEFVEFKTDFRIPVRRLRYKDGRGMPLRGDDFIGVRVESKDRLYFMKGEAKSRRTIRPAVVRTARKALANHDGRPTPISLLFVADRLLESDGEDERLGRKIRQEVARKSVPSSRIAHALFLLSGNSAAGLLENDLQAVDEAHTHIAMTMHIDDHGTFVAEVYEEAGNLGKD